MSVVDAPAADVPASPAKRRLFRRLGAAAQGEPERAPDRTPWRRVPRMEAGEGEVLWSGWAGDDRIFVVGDEGTILHYDGSVDAEGGLWHRMTSPTRLPLHAIWGRGPDELHAVGWMGVVLSFDGERWRQRRGGIVDRESKSFSASAQNTPLFALTGDETGRAWAVGDGGTILGFDGDAWESQDSPTETNLRGIVRTPGGRLFAVGGDGTVVTGSGDGRWELMDCPLNDSFTSVLALSDDDLLLAGGRYFVGAGGFRGELARWRDGHFSRVEIDQAIPRLRSLRAIEGGVLIAADQGHLYHLAGGRLDQLRTDNRHDLMDIVSLPTGEALAVGDFSTIITAAPGFLQALAPSASDEARDMEWERVESGTHHNLWGLHAAPDGVLRACGDAGTVLELHDGHWRPMASAGDLAVHCLWATDDGRLYAAGAEGQIFLHDADTWNLVFDLHLDMTILSMWGSGPDSIYAVGDEGLIVRWDGERWQRMMSGTKSALYGIWGLDDEHVLAVGDFGLILRWNGENWTEFHAGTDHFLFDIWGDSLKDIHVVALAGTIVHFDGKRWTSTSIRAREDLMAIDGMRGQRPFAVGNQGSILRFDGEHWQPEGTPSTTGLRAIRVCADGSVHAAGNEGTLLKRRSILEGEKR